MRNKEKITICMGSSCFARGNRAHLEIIEDFLKTHNLEADVDFSGRCCAGNCANGPNIEINGKLFSNVDSGVLMDILEEHFIKSKGSNGE